MNSFSFYVLKYSVELDLITKQDWQFNSTGQISPQCTGAALSKTAILTKIDETLRQAPVYSVDLEKCRKFTKRINRFTNSASHDQAEEVKQISSQILGFIKENSQKLPRYFTTSSAHKVDAILDKNLAKITEVDYRLLYDLANLLAYHRFFIHVLYLRFAIQSKMKELRLQAPTLKFYQKDGETFYKFMYRHPVEAKDCELALLLEWNRVLNPTLANIPPKLMKSVIRRKIETHDLIFKNHLDMLLTQYLIGALGTYSDELTVETKSQQDQYFKYIQTDQKILDTFRRELVHYPKSYLEWDGVCSPFDDPKKLAAIVKEVHEQASLSHVKFDEWYRLLCTKILDYKQLHPEAVLPLTSLETFSSYRNFISKDDIQLPLAKEFEQWTEEALRTFNAYKTTAPAPSQRKKQRSKTKGKNNSVEEAPCTENILKGEVEKSAPKSSISKTSRKKKKKRGKEVLSSQLDTQSMAEGSIHELLLKSSPFAVKKRVTDWFDPSAPVKILDTESPLMHKFAWAAQQVIWEVGLRHYFLNKEGFYEPAIALFCDVQHQLFSKPEPFLITVTFDHQVEESNRDPHFKFDPTWECYHRTLTRRYQQDEVVNEYMKIARNRFVDFPPLPSQVEQVDIPAMLDRNPFPDQSFIESIDGGVITIRDPKFDAKTKCRLRLFVHPSYIQLI